MAKKIKNLQNISEFASYKELARFKKKRSPHSVVFVTEDPEGWFIHCVEYKTKSGEVMYDDYIIEKDMNDWLTWHKNLGWEEV
jgi:hypothetical protein